MSSRDYYTAYKQKYKELKNQIGGGRDDTANVLIVVDVQNCFIAGGSFGGPSKNEKLIEEITNLVDSHKFDYFVVTRDLHPSHHLSHMVTSEEKGKVRVAKESGEHVDSPELDAFLGSIGVPSFEKVTPLGGPWPPHCRTTKQETQNINNCSLRPEEADTWDLDESPESDQDRKLDTYGEKIIGHNLSHFYNKSHEILQYFINPDMKLGLLDVVGEQNKHPAEARYYLNVLRSFDSIVGRPPVLQLFKGQLCSWDAYSAFQYHADFSIHPILNDVAGDLNNTTCLAEVLFSNEYGILKFKPSARKINIVVCGLVGEVCVKYTVSYGLNIICQGQTHGLRGYSRLTTSDSSCPVLTPNVIPLVNFIYSSYGTRFIPNPVVIGITEAEIENRLKEAVESGCRNDLISKNLLFDPSRVNGDGETDFTLESVVDLLE